MPRGEPHNIPLNGLFSLPPGLATASVTDRAKFWKLLGQEALRLKQGEIKAGIDIWGNKFQPIKRRWGVRTPLIPHDGSSRTLELLALNSTARGATLFWRSGGGRTSWPTILGYHAYKHGTRSLPVRNAIGLSPQSVEHLMVKSEEWQAGFEAGLATLKRPGIERPERFPSRLKGYVPTVRGKPVELGEVYPKPPRPTPKPKPKPISPKPVAIKLTPAQDRAAMAEADRLTREAQAEAQKMMEEMRRKHPVAEGVGGLAEGVTFIPAPYAKNRREVIVLVDVAKLDSAMAKNRIHYVGPGGTGETAKRGVYEQARKFIEKSRDEGKAVHIPMVHPNASTGEPEIGDGRHRWAALRDSGATVLPITASKGYAKKLQKQFGVSY